MRSKTWMCLAGCAVALAAASTASATTYVVDQAIGTFGSVTGTIVTDGALGTLSASDFSSWDLLVKGDGASVTLTNANSGVFISGTGPLATATDLSFDYSNPGINFLLFQAGGFGSQGTYWCNATTNGTCFQGATASPEFYNSPSVQVEARSGIQSIASASVAAVPEPATWAMLLVGFGAIGVSLRGRQAKVARFA